MYIKNLSFKCYRNIEHILGTGILGRHPTFVGRACGWSLGLIIAIGSCLTVLDLKIQQINDDHAQVLKRMQTLQADTSELLTELNAGYSPNCSAENLNQMRSLMFSHQYARNIGLLDAQHRLYCSTSIGRLDAPVTLKNGVDGSIGRYFLRTPVQFFNGTVHGVLVATVVERGNFQVMLDDVPLQDMFQRYTDSVWVGGTHQRRLVYKGARGGNAVVAADTAPVSLVWNTGHVLVTDTLPGISPISTQSVVSVIDVWENSHVILTGMLLLSVLLAYLVSSGVTRKCRYFQSIDFRIGYLCRPENIVCHYQPMLDLGTGQVVGCEVLARLRYGEKLLYPDQFIPALTRKCLTWTFDSLVSRQALQELSAALLPHTGFIVALNFFPQNLKRDILHRHLQSALQTAGHNSLHLELEVTEYDFSAEIVPELSRLKADGYSISIDDFGTGYSNLAIVKRVAPDYLKIDKSFVFEMEDVTIRSSLIPEIIAIARAVGSKVIAEGIETAAQLAQLRSLGVEYGQGYYFSKPIALADFLLFLRDGRTG